MSLQHTGELTDTKLYIHMEAHHNWKRSNVIKADADCEKL